MIRLFRMVGYRGIKINKQIFNENIAKKKSCVQTISNQIVWCGYSLSVW